MSRDRDDTEVQVRKKKGFIYGNPEPCACTFILLDTLTNVRANVEQQYMVCSEVKETLEMRKEILNEVYSSYCHHV